MSCLNFNFGLGELDVLGVVATKNTQIVHAGEEVVIEQEINHKNDRESRYLISIRQRSARQNHRRTFVSEAGCFSAIKRG
jgi:hypothetical protein